MQPHSSGPPEGQRWGSVTPNGTPSRPNVAGGASGSQGAYTPVGRGSYPPRPIERPPRSLPLAAITFAPKPRHRGRRIVIALVCVILVLTTAALVIEDILITTGQHLF